MPVIAAAIFVVLLIGWLFAEVKGGRGVRVSCGLLCMVMLIAILFFTSQRAALIQAQEGACFRLLGEALEKREYQKATRAVDRYNRPDASRHPTFQMLDVLNGKE